MIRITVSSLFVEDQDRAEAFYTEVLGFEKRRDIPLGEDRWLSVASPGDTRGVELLLEPNGNPLAATYQRGLYDAGLPATTFGVDDIRQEHERLKNLGVVFRSEPTEAFGSIVAVFDDTCGNFIQLHQPVTA